VKALIKVGYGCNENCTFCHTLDVRHIDGSSDEVVKKIHRAKELGHSMVVLSGGEPTTRPELLEWALLVSRLGMDFGLVTNGLMLAYPELVEKLLSMRLKYVYMSLHGGTPRVHNSLVRADTFSQAMQAVKNLSRRNLDLTINCVVARQNLDHLRELVDALKPFTDLTIKFSMVQPKGGGVAHFESLVPKVSEVAAAVRDAIEYAGRGRHDGIPLCLLPGLEDRYADLKTDHFMTMVEIGEPDFFPVDDLAKVQPEPCHDCALRGPCPGLYAGYHQHFGHEELMPITRTRSNSFNYVMETMVEKNGHCPLLDLALGITPWDRGRTLYVQNGDRVARFRAASRDFADVEIDRVKHSLGQLYLDVSKKDAPDDFARDLVPLRRSASCNPCEHKASCTGMFEPVYEDWFSRDDARVHEILAGLSGRILDIGCGDHPYRAHIAGDYVGIDPRLGRDAESLSVDEIGGFDHVLILRSWNHLRDPASVVRRLADGLRPGATLLVVDNVAFGLARTGAHARRAERSSAALEHYRNHSAADVLRLTRNLPFEVIQVREVSAETSNQWLVCFRRL
jgi:MoaA/NifB/PqqE/SkfB family radical SAM enzyme